MIAITSFIELIQKHRKYTFALASLLQTQFHDEGQAIKGLLAAQLAVAPAEKLVAH